MLIVHLPAGFLISRIPYLRRLSPKWLMLGAILPDLDMLWFHLIDAGVIHHHSYLTHRPAFWLMITLAGMALRRRNHILTLGIGGTLHMALDSMAGAIDWGWPLTPMRFTLVEIPATYDWWAWFFLTHSSFAVELAICATAAYVAWRARP